MTNVDVILLLTIGVFALALLPLSVIGAVLLGIFGSGVLICWLTWLDLDRFAILFGSLAMVAAVCGLPWTMAGSIWRHTRFRNMLGATSMDDLIRNRATTERLFFLALLLMLVLGAAGTFAIRVSMQVFELAEQVLDDGQPS